MNIKLTKKEIEEIKIARKRNEKIKKTSYKNLYMNIEDLRFATNELVAKYRAKRLKCNTIVEVGSGIGLQSIQFAKTCKKVYAIEIDERKVNYAKENARLLKIRNIEFIHGDALKVVGKIRKADIVFCETERAAEAQERSIEELKPGIKELMKAYRKLTDKFCIEVPPQLRQIKLNCEKEYVSVNHELNRLNLYFGPLKICDRSAVALPGPYRLESTNKKARKSKALKYIHEADKAVVKANLINELAIKEAALILNENFLTSKKKIKSHFFKSSYEVVRRCNKSFKDIIKALKEEGCGKVILRYNIKPEKYWEERKKYEKLLKGKKTLYLFLFGKSTLVCEKL